MTVAESLSGLFPTAAIVRPAEAMVAPDASGQWFRSGTMPEAIVSPADTVEVATVMKWASAEGVGVLPLGTGAHTEPVIRSGRYVALSCERLSGIEIYDAADLTITAGAGTPMVVLGAALGAEDQWLPFDPPHVATHTIGGLAARGESGPLWMGYGALRNHVLGMTIVTGDGRTLRLGGRVVKNVAGYDLLKPMTGSAGGLSVITSVCMRTFPVPEVDRVLALVGDSPGDVTQAALGVATAPVVPVSSVITDQASALGGSAALLVRLHGSEQTVNADQASIERHLGVELTALDGGVVESTLKEARDRASDAEIVLLASALPSRLPGLLAAMARLAPSAMVVDTYLARARVALEGWDPDAIRTCQESVEHLGGALSLARVPEGLSTADLGTERSADEYDLTRGLEGVFDPAGVLWPARR